MGADQIHVVPTGAHYLSINIPKILFIHIFQRDFDTQIKLGHRHFRGYFHKSADFIISFVLCLDTYTQLFPGIEY